MRKKIITPSLQTTPSASNHEWLDIEDLVDVEISSENAAHPIEAALLLNQSGGWQASEPGVQTLRLIFTKPQALQRIWLNFIETSTARGQEYVLSWSADTAQPFQEIVRQQWNFSPTGSTSETEDHHVNLSAVSVLELSIIPDIEGGDAYAKLAQLRLA